MSQSLQYESDQRYDPRSYFNLFLYRPSNSLRPVVVNIPRDEWSCPTCSPVRQVTFGSIMEKLKSNPKDVMVRIFNMQAS